MTNTLAHSRFAICITNKGSDDLQVWKLYQVLDDPTVAVEDYLRVVDDSGEDYLYPANSFVIVEFPSLIERKLLASASVAT